LLGSLDRIGGMIDDLEHSEEVDISEPLARLQPLIDPAPAQPAGAIRVQPRVRSAPVASVAQASEFTVSDQVRSGWKQGGAFLYGVKLDWFTCEREFDLVR
jgi:hypothetical protein